MPVPAGPGFVATPTGPLVYDPVLSRVLLSASGLANSASLLVQRSTDLVRWSPVRGGTVTPSAGAIRVSDYEFAPDVTNHYRVLGPTLADGFGRTLASQWGPADTDQSWAVVGTASSYSVNGTRAVHSHPSRGVVLESRQDISLADVDMTLTGITLSQVPAGSDNDTDVQLAARQTGADRVEATLFFRATDNTVTLSVRQLVGGVETFVGFPTVAGVTTTTPLSLRMQASGTSLRAKAWPTVEAEPVGWTASMATTLTAPGFLRVRSVIAGGTTNPLPMTITYDSFVVSSPQVPLYEGSITPQIGGVWLKSLARPFLNRQVTVRDFSEVSRPARGGVFEVVGRSFPVAVTDVRGSRRWTLQVSTDTPQQANELDLLLAGGDILLVHVPQAAGRISAVPGGYVTVGDTREVTPPTFDLQMRVFDLPCVEVAAPGPDVIGSTVTCQSVLNTYATCQAVLDAHPTCLSLMELIGDPTDVIVA